MNIRKLLTQLVSLALIAVFLPTVAMADTWYLEDGSITVSATDSGQNVSQGGVTKEDSAPVIRNRDSSASTTNNVTIRADAGVLHLLSAGPPGHRHHRRRRAEGCRRRGGENRGRRQRHPER